MRSRFLPHLFAAFCFVLAMLPLGASAQTTNDYQSSLGYVVSWSDDWIKDDDFGLVTDGQLDLMTLFAADGQSFVMVTGFDTTLIAAQDMIEPEATANVTDEDLDADVPYTVIEEDGAIERTELYLVNDGQTGIVVVLWGPADDFDDILATAQETVTINDSPVLIGQPLGEAEATPEDEVTAEATEATTTGSTRNTRSTVTEEATVEATESTTTGSTRNTRSTATEEVTAEATETTTSGGSTRSTRSTATEEATETTTSGSTRSTRTSSSTDDPGTYTSPIYGATIQYDPAAWEQVNTYQDDSGSYAEFHNDASVLTVWELNEYGADVSACLDQGSETYAAQNELIENWQIATRANGKEMISRGDTEAWGVYTFTSDGDARVAYISCQVVPGEDAVFVVMLTTSPEEYNAQLDLVLEILDTLKFAN